MLLNTIFDQLEQENEWNYRNKYIQNKNSWFSPTTEDKEVKLLTIQQNSHFVIIYWCGKHIDLLEAVIGCILKNKSKKRSCLKSWCQALEKNLRMWIIGSVEYSAKYLRFMKIGKRSNHQILSIAVKSTWFIPLRNPYVLFHDVLDKRVLPTSNSSFI